MAFGVETLDDAAREARRHPRHAAAARASARRCRGLLKLKSVADSRPKTVSKGACQEVVHEGADVDLRRLPVQRCWPGDPAPFITLPAVITKDPQTGTPQRRDVPDAGHRPQLDLHALADAQGRARRPARGRGRADPGRGRDRARPGDRLLRERAAAEAPRRAHARRLPARRARGARRVQDGSTSRYRRTPRSSSRARSRRTTSASRGRSATTLGTTRTPSRSRSSGSRRSRCGVTRSTRRSSSASPRRRTPGSARRPSASSCRPCA